MRRWCSLLDRPGDPGGGARRPRAAGRGARRLPGAGRALRPAGRAARRSQRARPLAAPDRRRGCRSAGPARAGAGGPRARAERGAGAPAARSTIWSGSPAPPSFPARAPRRSKRRWPAPSPTPRRSWPFAPRALYQEAASGQGRRAPLSPGPRSRRRERRCTVGARGALPCGREAGGAGRGARTTVGGRARSAGPAVAAARGGAAL